LRMGTFMRKTASEMTAVATAGTELTIVNALSLVFFQFFLERSDSQMPAQNKAGTSAAMVTKR
jgi:hypothetical protein